MREEHDRRIRRNIIKKLFSKGCFGNGHLLLIRLQKGVSKEDAGFVKDVVKQLIKEGIVMAKVTKHGTSVYLNMAKLPEIEKIINEYNNQENR